MFEIKRNESGFRYIEAFGGAHDCKRIRIYIKSICQLPEEPINGNVVIFPLKGFKIITSEKGTFIIVPDERFIIHHVAIKSGYRGWAEIHTGGLYQNETHIEWTEYHSPAGNLGCTANLLISLNQDRVISWAKSGRRVTETAGEIILRADGRISEFDDPELE